ncbi:MAG: hypothetical protein ACRED0_00690 [Gammaproteobacteria bacterium]
MANRKPKDKLRLLPTAGRWSFNRSTATYLGPHEPNTPLYGHFEFIEVP